jgi:diacylglycerol kinase family enzyme
MTRRLAAAAALLLAAASLVAGALLAIDNVGHQLLALALIVLAVLAAGHGVLRRGVPRAVALVLAALLTLAAVAVIVHFRLLWDLAVVGGFGLAAAAAATALTTRVSLPSARPPARPVLFLNPHSGGGKAERFGLVEEALRRGIEPVELKPGDNLGELVATAVRDGADGLAMAGGDGSQAIVAALAARHRLPYACIPAGTRNHFALDLGVDREDVVGALDAFVAGGERTVDLAEVNGRVFVNNVSLGIYAAAVQREGYRDAKLRTLLETVPDVLGPDGAALDLRWTGPHGTAHATGAAILVSNNAYRLGRVLGSGTRPALDAGVLGIAVVEAPGRGRTAGRPPWRQWTDATFEIVSDAAVAAGIDGEAAMLDAPLRFRSLPGALRVRVADAHPGASPSAALPDGLPALAASLALIAVGRWRPSHIRPTGLPANAPAGQGRLDAKRRVSTDQEDGTMAEPQLKKGSTGDAVRQLQTALKALGYDVGAVDGQFGAKTEAAVKKFQSDRGIAADGIVGPITWVNIDEADQSEPTLKKGSTGNPVRRLQKRISLGGWDTGGVDGVFGASTEAAVKKFQGDNGLVVDGIVGPATWAKVDALGD